MDKKPRERRLLDRENLKEADAVLSHSERLIQEMDDLLKASRELVKKQAELLKRLRNRKE